METTKQKQDLAAKAERAAAGEDLTAPVPEQFHRQPYSFVRRGDRLTARRQKAWDTYAPTHVLDLPRKISDTSVAEGAVFDQQALYGRTDALSLLKSAPAWARLSSTVPPRYPRPTSWPLRSTPPASPTCS